jgi:hypothetical protein
MFKRLSILLATAAAGLAFAGLAHAKGGNYTFVGGTPVEQAQVKAALDASAFDWSLVPAEIKIRIGKGYPAKATRGNIWLDSGLLASGQFSWGTVQHEYGHQVDFFLLDAAKRTVLAPQLGGSSWWQTASILDHDDLTSERFASTLAWSYWPNAANSMKPESAHDESAGMEPSKFRSLLKQMIGAPDTLTAAEGAAEATPTWGTSAKPTKKAAKAKKAAKPKKTAKAKKRRGR